MKLVGNAVNSADASLQFKDEISQIFETYAMANTSLGTDMFGIIANESSRNEFIDTIARSATESTQLTSEDATNDAFFGNYADRISQLVTNSTLEIAREAAITGWAPIVSYSPFLIKKQWVSCIWKDVFLSEVTNTPILNFQFEKRYIVGPDFKEYPIPDAYYDPTLMASLLAASTGTPLIDQRIELPMKNICLIDPTKNTDTTKKYFPDGFVVRNPSETLTQDICISKVIFKDGTTEYTKPCDIHVDITTHAFVHGNVSYAVKNPTTGDVVKVLTDELIGNVNFDTGSVTLFSTTGVVVGIHLAGKAANRFNHNTLDVKRRTEQIQKLVPESGPRINSTVTIEEAADAIVLGKIDMFGDKVDQMGGVLANLQDAEIRAFADKSLEINRAVAASTAGTESFGYGNFVVVEGGFNTMPVGNFTGNQSDYQKDVQEYFERYIENIKYKLNTQNAIITCVCHPTLVRYLKNDVKWIFNDQTDISGLQIAYRVGITTVSGDRMHIITSNYMSPDDGIRSFLIPTTTELITFKNIMYSIVVDRGYRHPLEPLVPNVMATQRQLTFEVFPIQGKFDITGRDLRPADVRKPVAMTGSFTTTAAPTNP